MCVCVCACVRACVRACVCARVRAFAFACCCFCNHQNDSCIKMGSNESHFNVSLIVRDIVTRQCPQPTTFEENGEPKRIRTEVPLLTGLMPYR